MDQGHENLRAMIRRVILEEIDTTGAQHLARVSGLASETLKDVPRVKDFGFSSSPPAGATALIAALGGRSDRSMIFGIDHPDFGPRDLAPGHAAIYDAYGNIVSLVETEIRMVATTKIHLKAPTITLESPVIKLGSDGASKPASMQGTVDTGGFADVSNLSTKVLVE